MTAASVPVGANNPLSVFAKPVRFELFFLLRFFTITGTLTLGGLMTALALSNIGVFPTMSIWTKILFCVVAWIPASALISLDLGRTAHRS